jgi:hypothetical protein
MIPMRIVMPIALFFFAVWLLFTCRATIAHHVMAMNLEAMTGVPPGVLPMMRPGAGLDPQILAFSYVELIVAVALFALVIRFGMGPAFNFWRAASYATQAALISPALAALAVVMQLPQSVAPTVSPIFSGGGTGYGIVQGIIGAAQATATANRQALIANQIARLIALGLVLIWFALVLRRERDASSKQVPTVIGLAVVAFLFA